jgi:hypothetical protein
LESRVRRSAIVPEFQDALLASISFLETRRNLKGPNQASKDGGGSQLCFYWPKIAANTKQCELAHCHNEATNPGSVIVPDVFGGLAPSGASKSLGSNAGSPFGLEEQIPGEQCPHNQKRSPTYS